MTPPATVNLRARRPLYNLQSLSSGSTSTIIKQEDASTSYYVREPSLQSRLTSPPYQPNILRGDQRSFNDSREINNSASLSIFSSEGDLTDNYQQEERVVEQLQNNQQEMPRPGGIRRISGQQRKGRMSADNLAYRPGSDDEDEDDDNIRSPTRRRKKGRNSNSNSLGAFDRGRIDNATWMIKGGKRVRRRKSGGNGAQGEEEDDENAFTPEYSEDDAGAASGKETRFDGASDNSESDEDEDPTPLMINDKPDSQHKKAKGRSVITQLFSSLAFLLATIFKTFINQIGKLLKRAWTSLGRDMLHGIVFSLGALLLASTVYYIVPHLTKPTTRLSPHPSLSDDLPNLSQTLSRENAYLRSELSRLTNRLDTLSSSIESRISSSLSQISSESTTRQNTELSRLTSSTKRSITRMAETELKNIQESVSSSVELLLRDLDKRINSQLNSRADDTESKFFSKLESEVSRIAKYANDEVNSRLGQAFDQNFLAELIDEKLEVFAQDRTGKIDWASVTSGGWVEEGGTVHRGFRYNSVWNVGRFLGEGRKVAIGEPVKAITPGMGSGCWMTGWNSFLQIRLAEPKVIEELVIEHPLPSMRKFAPRRILVWGIVDESDRQYYAQYRRSQSKSTEEYFKELLPEAYFKAIPEEYKKEDNAPLLLGYHEFNTTASTLQKINLTEEAQAYPYGVEAVRWQFVDGWGKSPPICVERVRVHGGDWPVFANKEVE